MRALRIALLALCLAAGVLFVTGCHHHSGRQVYWSHYNLRVDNTDWHYIHVLVDGGDMGLVAPDGVGTFWLTSGYHEIAIRESGSPEVYVLGVFEFNWSEVVHIVY